MIYLATVIMGVVEGLTEFLPISSTGHLILVGELLHFDRLLGAEAANAFKIIIQLGAILAVIGVFPGRFLRLVRFNDNRGFAGLRGLGLLVVTSIPAAVLGLAAKRSIEKHLFGSTTVILALAVGAVAILVVERWRPAARIEGLDALGWREAGWIGVFQCFALWPGMSRAASTIVGGMLSGVDRRTATEYSFFAAVPVMIAATGLKLVEIVPKLDAAQAGILALGFAVAFVSAWIAVKLFIHFVARHTLVPFAWYRLALAGLVFWSPAKSATAAAAEEAPPRGKREARRVDPDLARYTVSVVSSKDGAPQKVLFYVPEGADKDAGAATPLLVGLHTWSGGYEQGPGFLPYVRQRKWILVAPDFRGPNRRAEACASDLAVQDVLDAVDYARRHARVDDARIYVVGSSGGGHMSLMMAARAPQLWAAVSAWVPISDLAAWHAESAAAWRNYATMLEQVCGGRPGTPTTDAQYRARSPLFLLAAAKGLPLDINAGIHDGHTGSVPISHSLRAFNVLAAANGLPDRQIAAADIAAMVQTQRVPDGLAGEKHADPERQKAVLLRRVAGPARITIFEGGHDSELSAALDWLARQRRGQAAVHAAPAGSRPTGRPAGSQAVER